MRKKNGREKETEKERKMGEMVMEREKLSFLKVATGPGSILHNRT